MKKEYYFTGGEVRLLLARPASISAESREEAEDILVEHIRDYGEVYDFAATGNESAGLPPVYTAPVETCPY